MSVAADAPLVVLEELPERAYRRIVDINLGGVVYGLQALLPHLRAAGIDMMSAEDLAEQVVALLLDGGNGEVRLCLRADREPLSVAPPKFD